MFSCPMFRWEWRMATRRRKPFVFRTSLALTFGSVAVLTGLAVFTRGRWIAGEPVDAYRLRLFGLVALAVTYGSQVILLAFFTPNLVGDAIAREREQDTLSQLLLTRLTPIEICLLYTSPSPRDKRHSRMPSSA